MPAGAGHISETGENAADTAHVQPLHGQIRLPWTRVPLPGAQVVQTLERKLDPVQPCLMHFDDELVQRMFARRMDRAKAQTRISFFGPASLLLLRCTLSGRDEIVMYQTLLLVGRPEHQIDCWWFTDQALPRWLVWYVIANWSNQLPADLDVRRGKL